MASTNAFPNSNPSASYSFPPLVSPLPAFPSLPPSSSSSSSASPSSFSVVEEAKALQAIRTSLRIESPYTHLLAGTVVALAEAASTKVMAYLTAQLAPVVAEHAATKTALEKEKALSMRRKQVRDHLRGRLDNAEVSIESFKEQLKAAEEEFWRRTQATETAWNDAMREADERAEARVADSENRCKEVENMLEKLRQVMDELVASCRVEIAAANARADTMIAVNRCDLEAKHDSEVKEMTENHAEEVVAMKTEHANAVAKAAAEHAAAMSKLIEQHSAAIAASDSQHAEAVRVLDQTISELKAARQEDAATAARVLAEEAEAHKAKMAEAIIAGEAALGTAAAEHKSIVDALASSHAAKLAEMEAAHALSLAEMQDRMMTAARAHEDAMALAASRATAELKEQAERADATMKALRLNEDKARADMVHEMKQKHAEDRRLLLADMAAERATWTTSKRESLQRLVTLHEAELKSLATQKQSQFDTLVIEHKQAIDVLVRQHKAALAETEAKSERAKGESYPQLREEIDRLRAELTEKRRELDTGFSAIQKQYQESLEIARRDAREAQELLVLERARFEAQNDYWRTMTRRENNAGHAAGLASASGSPAQTPASMLRRLSGASATTPMSVSMSMSASAAANAAAPTSTSTSSSASSFSSSSVSTPPTSSSTVCFVPRPPSRSTSFANSEADVTLSRFTTPAHGSREGPELHSISDINVGNVAVDVDVDVDVVGCADEVAAVVAAAKEAALTPRKPFGVEQEAEKEILSAVASNGPTNPSSKSPGKDKGKDKDKQKKR